MKKSILENVYQIKESPEAQADNYEQQIKHLKQQLAEVLGCLRESSRAA